MLRIYDLLLSFVGELAPLVREVERRDADLARQCRRALSSAPLNVAEGSYARGGSRNVRYSTAAGSLREVRACFEVGAALGYIAPLSAETVNRFDQIIGTLVKITGR